MSTRGRHHAGEAPAGRAGCDEVDVALAVVWRDGAVLLARRVAGGPQGGRWEFPGGKLETGEPGAAAALRELEEETGLSGGAARFLAETRHAYPDGRVRLRAYLITGSRGDPQPRASREVRWVRPERLTDFDMPKANAPLLQALRRRAAAQ